MLLAIDVGNTNMVFGIYEGTELKGSFRLMTDANRTSDEVGLLVCQYFQRFGVELEQLETACRVDEAVIRALLRGGAPSQQT